MFSRIARLRAKKGFTLVEVIVVIAIIGILTAMILPNVIYDGRPASGKAMAKDLYYNIQDVLASAEIARPGEIEDGTCAYFYADISDIGTISASGRVVLDGSTYVKKDYTEDSLLDSKIKYAFEHYTTDKEQMAGTLYVEIDSDYRVLNAYWSNEDLSTLQSSAIREECVLDSGYYLCTFPIAKCDTKGAKIFVA